MTYPLRPAVQEESGHIKGELDLGVVVAQAAVHLTGRAHVEDGLQGIRPRVPRGIQVILAEARARVADEEGLDGAQGVLFKVEGAGGALVDVVDAEAVVDTVGACFHNVL